MKHYWYKPIRFGKHRELSIWLQIGREWFLIPTIKYYCHKTSHSVQFLWMNCKITFLCNKVYTEEEFTKIIKENNGIVLCKN